MSQSLRDLDFHAEYDGTTGTYQASIGTERDVPITWAIISLTSVAAGADLTEIQPLADVIDPEALDALFRSSDTAFGLVEFEYEGFAVTVTSDGEVMVSDPNAAR